MTETILLVLLLAIQALVAWWTRPKAIYEPGPAPSPEPALPPQEWPEPPDASDPAPVVIRERGLVGAPVSGEAIVGVLEGTQKTFSVPIRRGKPAKIVRCSRSRHMGFFWWTGQTDEKRRPIYRRRAR